MSKYPNTPQAVAQALIDRFGAGGVVPSNTYSSIAEVISRLPNGSGLPDITGAPVTGVTVSPATLTLTP